MPMNQSGSRSDRGLDVMGWRLVLLAKLDQAFGVVRVTAPDDHDRLDLPHQIEHRPLSEPGRTADRVDQSDIGPGVEEPDLLADGFDQVGRHGGLTDDAQPPAFVAADLDGLADHVAGLQVFHDAPDLDVVRSCR